MEQTIMTGPWRMWVCPERKIVSFHPENGFHFLEFQSRELCGSLYRGAVSLPVRLTFRRIFPAAKGFPQ